MSTHNGAVLCLNCLSFASSPDKTREEEHVAIIEGLAAAKAQGSPCGAIVLQDYPWSSAQGLDSLVKMLNESTGDSWDAVRQWGNDQDENAECLRDAVVLYDTAIYVAKEAIDKDSVGAFRDREGLLDGMQENIKLQLAGFIGRWAGVEIAPASNHNLPFLLISFHGRKIIRANNDVLPVQTVVKAAMCKDFISQIADLGGKEASPVLIAGCWNTDSVPLTVNGGVNSDASSKVKWTSSVHHPHEIQTDAIGQPMNSLDYSVAIHPEAVAVAADLKVTDVIALRHPTELASHFQHRPLLVKFDLVPRSA